MSQIVTSDKSYIYRYHKKPTQEESTPENIYCPYCGKTKKRIGRYWFCPDCRNIKLPSGKPMGKIPKKWSK